MGADRALLRSDARTVGFLFESAVIHDLLVFASALGGQVHHYRDSYGHEIDAVVTLPGRRWGVVEVKVGGRQMRTGAASLSKAVKQVDPGVEGEPAFRLVVTGTGPTLTMEGGTITCPLAALRP